MIDTLNLQHVNVKIFVDGELTIDLEDVIKIFHRWVANQAIDDLLLIDVADYRHVPNGPGVVVLGHEADYGLDFADNKPGLLYNCKVEASGTNEARFADAIRAAARVCLLLESELDGLKFSRSQVEFCINDRCVAPNTDETRAAVEPELPQIVAGIAGHDGFSIEYNADKRVRFGGTITFDEPLDFGSL